jgi:hypothetical protein
MKQAKKSVLGGLMLGALLLVASPSFAQDSGGVTGTGAAAAGAGGGSGGNGDYGYKFDDDPLSAGGFGPADATIRVRPGPVRTTLIRPRTSFVPEMLKSVENI